MRDTRNFIGFLPNFYMLGSRVALSFFMLFIAFLFLSAGRVSFLKSVSFTLFSIFLDLASFVLFLEGFQVLFMLIIARSMQLLMVQ